MRVPYCVHTFWQGSKLIYCSRLIIFTKNIHRVCMYCTVYNKNGAKKVGHAITVTHYSPFNHCYTSSFNLQSFI